MTTLDLLAQLSASIAADAKASADTIADLRAQLAAKPAPKPIYAEPAWTAVATPDASTVYVSATAGNDNEAGTAAFPLKTIAAAIKKKPKAILLRCGHTFSDIGDVSFSGFIGGFGPGPRPVITATKGPALQLWHMDNLLVQGVEIRQPDANRESGVRMDTCNGITFEDCLFANCCKNIEIISGTGKRPNNITVRGCISVDAWGGTRAQGIYADHTDNLLVEDTLFDNNGWKSGVATDLPMECHAAYIHESCGPAIFRRNIVARSCANGIMVRMGGTVSDNLLLNNPIHVVATGNAANVTGNVLIGDQRLAGDTTYNVKQYGETRGWGIDFGAAGGEISGNGFYGVPEPIRIGPIQRADPKASQTLGIFHNQGDGKLSVTATRAGLATEEIKPAPAPKIDINAFLTGARAQRAGAWKAEFTAGAVK